MTAPVPTRSSVWVPGIPRPQGSKSPGRNGRMYEASKYLAGWREAVAIAAKVARMPLVKKPHAVRLDLTFAMPRPTDPRALASLPDYPTRVPDRDKLERAVCDALKGIAYEDDCQVCDGQTSKIWADGPTAQEDGPGVYIVCKSLEVVR